MCWCCADMEFICYSDFSFLDKPISCQIAFAVKQFSQTTFYLIISGRMTFPPLFKALLVPNKPLLLFLKITVFLPSLLPTSFNFFKIQYL